MPGFDGTGPEGMGPMTGWGRGLCGPYGGRGSRRSFGPWSGWGGRGRGWRHRYWATGMPGWGRMYPPPWGGYSGPAYSHEDELAVLKEEAAWLNEELNAVEERLRELESRQADEG
jgi:hypothetical protein